MAPIAPKYSLVVTGTPFFTWKNEWINAFSADTTQLLYNHYHKKLFEHPLLYPEPHTLIIFIKIGPVPSDLAQVDMPIQQNYYTLPISVNFWSFKWALGQPRVV